MWKNNPICGWSLEGASFMSSKWNVKRDTNNQHKQTLILPKNNLFTKAIITTALLSTVTFNLAFANESKSDEDASFEKIYHVYVGDSYIGVVRNAEAISEVILTKEREVKKLYKDYDLNSISNISVIPEQVFSYEVDDNTTLSKLQQELVIEAEAYAVQINGQPVAFLKNKEDYEKTLRLLKLQYVTEKQLKTLEESKSLPSLKENETRIKEIKFNETVSGNEVKVNPKKILTPEKVVEYLKTGTLEKEIYKVKEGDVLSTIANKHGLKTKELLDLNPKLTEDSLLKIGQEINVTVLKPLVNIQIVLEKKSVETIPYKEVVKEDSSMFKGETVVKQEGTNGKKEVSYLITEVNGTQVEKEITKEVVLTEPKDHIKVVGTKVISSRGTGVFGWPTVGGYISSHMGSRWGSYHRGIDIARPSNYNIKASDNGVVTFTGWDGTYGKKIVISHNNGFQTIYAHLSEIQVNVGQVVPKGSVIGIMGATGNSTGVHLHFEVHKNGAIQNPLNYLN